MRESIGTVSLLNFIIFFILLIFAFLMGTFSYYKAYKVNNAMVSAIEKYEGFNALSFNEINNKLMSYGYNSVNFDCVTRRSDGDEVGQLLAIDGSGESVYTDTNENRGYEGYCVYVYENDSLEKKESDVYESYEVTTVITFQFPIIQNVLKLRVSSRTGRIYDFQSSNVG